MPGAPNRLNHPLISYLLGFVFIGLTLVVLAGVLHHLAFSHHGPQLLKPLNERYKEKGKSAILDEAKSIEEMEEHRHFHHTIDYQAIPEDKRPVCFICHSDYPHKENKRIRALMNMHTQYFVCETCHVKEKPGAKVIYRWYSPFEKDPKGPFFGTSNDAETGQLNAGDPFSRIAPYYKHDLMDYSSLSDVKADNLWPAIQVQSAPIARDFIKVRDKLSPEQRDGVKNKFHENIKPKGHDCKTCHSGNSILDFKELGFSDKRISDLAMLEILGMITKYEEFYLPELFDHPVPGSPKKE